MRFVIVLTVVLSLPLSPLAVMGAARTESGSVAGSATSSTGQVLANATVQLRDLATGTVSGTTTSSSTGRFSFAAVSPGNYVVEVLNAAAQVVGTSASISVGAGDDVSGVAVIATAPAVTAAAASATNLRTIVAVTSAAAAAGVLGIVAVGQGDASPSR
jgi:hypothetical protein